MVYKIIWTKNAENNYNSILDYLLIVWSLEITQQFIITTTRRLNNLCLQPYVGKIAMKDKNVRSVLLSKHNRLFILLKTKI